MSVLLEFSMFPTDMGESVAKYVAKVIKMIDESGYDYQLTPMGTIIETYTVEEALEVVQDAYMILEPHSNRVYSSLKMDIRKGHMGRLKSKIASVEKLIGEVSK
jgi:uncharacterized protein (TIGR00106 family)